jgi:hypothetical protein
MLCWKRIFEFSTNESDTWWSCVEECWEKVIDRVGCLWSMHRSFELLDDVQ